MNPNQNPVIYDATGKVHRPMVPGQETMTPSLIALSATPGNRLQSLGDGLYLGAQGTAASPYQVYVNSSTGTDAPANGAKTTPYRTLDYALQQVQALFPSSLFSGYVNVLLQAGQSFSVNNDVTLYSGILVIGFYGDPQYGDMNSTVGGTTNSQNMADLARPIITFGTSLVNGLNHLAGFNRHGGSLSFVGVQLNLPVAPAAPSNTLYTNYSDVVRSLNNSDPGIVTLVGTIVNMTDVTAYWGLLGVHARSSNTTLTQFTSQFWVDGRALSATASPAPTTAELTQRQFFIKFYADYAGNNQSQVFMEDTTANSSTASGLLNLTWADVSALVVTGAKTNLATFPVAFDLTYGLRNYIYNLNHDQQQRPLNVVSSRLI
jgi:hypothetical protein